MTFWSELTKGMWLELPPFRLVLGLCPALAVTTSVENGIGMGIAVLFVTTMSNIIIAATRKVIPHKARIACFIAIIASIVVGVELIMQAIYYPLFLQLGIFVPLIAVNCIILGRAEAFAIKNNVWLSLADGLGFGTGFGISLVFLGGIREILGKGTFYDINVVWNGFEPFGFMVEAPGAFIALGLMLATLNFLNIVRARRAGLAAPVNPACGCQTCGNCNMGQVN